VESAAPCSRQITTPAPQHSVLTGRTPFLPLNQRCQSTEGKIFKIYLTLNLEITSDNVKWNQSVIWTDCLSILLSISIFYFSVLSFFHLFTFLSHVKLYCIVVLVQWVAATNRINCIHPYLLQLVYLSALREIPVSTLDPFINYYSLKPASLQILSTLVIWYRYGVSTISIKLLWPGNWQAH